MRPSFTHHITRAVTHTVPMTLTLSLTLMLGGFACSDASDDDQAYNDESYSEQSSSEDRAHQRAIDAIRNGEEYQPNANQVQYQQQGQQQGYNNQPQQNNQYAQSHQNPQAYQTQNNNPNGQNQQPAQNQQSQQAQQAQPAQPAAANRQFSVFREHKLTDPGMNNAHSHTVLVPEGWQVEGGLNRPNIRLYNMPTMVDLKVTSPDGRQARIMPALSFEFNNQSPAQPGSATLNGNIYMPLPESAGKWILGMAQSQPDPSIQNLKLVSEKMEETLTAQLRQQAQPFYQSTAQFNQTAAGIGMGAVYDTQAQVITFTYTKDGQPFEETFLLCWYINLTTIRGQLSNGMWGVTLMISVRDKPGNDPSKDPMLQTIFQSFRPTAAWQNEMNKYWAELRRITSKGSADRAAQNAAHNDYMRKNNEEINNIIASGYKNRSESSDRIQRNTIDGIREVTPYHTPQGETVRLPSHYSHAYTDGNGRYLLNNDSNFNPNVEPGFKDRSWQTVEQAPAGAQ